MTTCYLNAERSLSNDSGEGRLIVDMGEESGDEQMPEIKLTNSIDCDDPIIMKFSMLESRFVNDEYDEIKDIDDETSTDNEDQEPSIHFQDVSVLYKRFGQGILLFYNLY